MAKLLIPPAARPAEEGEALVVSQLQEALPGTYTLIPNVELVPQGQTAFEYDLIVIAPHAVYVVEVKNWRGGISGDDHIWTIAGRFQRPNPWFTANNKARVLKNELLRRQPACQPLWVEALMVIATDEGQLDLRGRVQQHVVRLGELAPRLMDAAALGHRAGNLRPFRAYLEDAISGAAHDRQGQPLQFGDYVVRETLFQGESVSEYLAGSVLLRNEGAVRLRVFANAPYLPAEQLKLRHEAICREANALQQIGEHPNLIRIRQFGTVPQDPNLLYEVTEWSEEGTLRSLMQGAAPLLLERKLGLAYGIAAALKAAHDAGVIHRDVRPENVLIGRDGQPRLMNFDHARLNTPGALSVSGVARDPDVSQAYLAPELMYPELQPTPAADLYGLGMILFELLVGRVLHQDPEAALAEDAPVGDPAAFGVVDLPVRLNELVLQLANPEPKERPQSADTVLDVLRAIREKPSATEVAPQDPGPAPIDPEQQPEPAIFEVNSVIDGKYLVQKVLDAGGSGRVYKVYDEIADRVYALKVFEGSARSLDFLRREVRFLERISHPHIVTYRGWGRLPRTGRLYLVTDFIEGENLAAFTKPERHLSAAESVDRIMELLSALKALHPDADRIEALQTRMAEGEIDEDEYEEFQRLRDEGLLHRDIKPANLMLAHTGLVLVDFNIAAWAREADRTWAGTPGYMLPDVGIVAWDADGDLFAAGVVLYELVTGHHPYPDRQPNAETPPTDPREYQPDLHPEFASLLLRAVSCDRAERYHSASRFLRDLEDLQGVYIQALPRQVSVRGMPLEDHEVDRPDYNPFVTRFLTLYSQARRSNRGTRGLDMLAQQTYVETRLDRLLRPVILEGRYRLVIVTGNAGDGKTAFIQQVEETVRQQGVRVEQLSANSSAFTYQGVRYLTNYDGSQDEGAERANDRVLSEFFAPFDDVHLKGWGDERFVRLIAVNEGRLIDFFSEALYRGEQAGFTERFHRLGEVITGFFSSDTPEPLPEWLLIVDLNQRSMTVHEEMEGAQGSIYERQLLALLQPEFWQPCEACAHRERCFIYYNVRTLADPVSGSAVRERLRALLEVVELRRQMHITMRDMRSAMSWLLFRDHSCDDVGRLLSEPNTPVEKLDLLYINAYAADGRPAPGQRDDRLVALLRQVDPAQVTDPLLDRGIHFQGLDSVSLMGFEGRGTLATDWLKEWRPVSGWEASQRPELTAEHRQRHAVLRRMAFYERRDDRWLPMLPYRHLARFLQATRAVPGEPDLAEAQEAIARGISLAEGARDPQRAARYVFLRAGGSDRARLKSFRLFPLDSFSLRLPALPGQTYIEYAPDRLILAYQPPDVSHGRANGAAELVIPLDLFEFLLGLGEGFAPSADDLGGAFINLSMFKHALIHQPYRYLLLTRDDRDYYRVEQTEVGRVTLEHLAEGNSGNGA